MKMKRKYVKFKVTGNSNVFKGYLCECDMCDFDDNDYFIKLNDGGEFHSHSIDWYRLAGPSKSHLPSWW